MKRTKVLGLVMVAAAIFLSGCDGDVGQLPDPVETRTHLATAHALCAENSEYTILRDGGVSVIIENAGKFFGAPMSEVDCILEKLEAPEAMLAQMGNTRALDGMQRYEWETDNGSFVATWNYHPDDGVNMIITQE